MNYLSFDIGIKNMAFCVLNKDEVIQRWGLFSIDGGTLEKQCTRLAKHLDELNIHGALRAPKDNDEEPEGSGAQSAAPSGSGAQSALTVIIEKQPRINAKMRVIEGYLLMYFVMKKMQGCENIHKILTYSARHKLKLYTGPLDKQYNLKTHYGRKRTAIQHCKKIIGNNPDNQKWLDFFEEHKKKADDLSDSFLQGLSYIRKQS